MGYLKRCIKYGRYHSGKMDNCQDCGFVLFYVYKHDITKCVGRVSGNILTNNNFESKEKGKNDYYVLVYYTDNLNPYICQLITINRTITTKMG